MTPQDRPTITLVIPAFNEGARLGATLAALRSWLADGSLPGLERVLICDDGSTDDTATLAGEAAASDDRIVLVAGARNQGKGAAVRRGFSMASTDLVCFVDADLPVPVDTLAAMTAAIGDTDLLVGTRRAPGSTFVRPQPALRRLGGRAFLLAVGALGFRATSDPQCGVKVLGRAGMAPTVDRCRCDRFAFDIELVSNARRDGRTIAEFPVHWIHVDGSTVRPVRDAASTLWSLARLRRQVRA